MLRFPDPAELPEGESVVAVSGDLSVETLKEAYGSGIFPWPAAPGLIPWHCPDPRGILRFSELHIPRSVKQARKKKKFSFSFDRDFKGVIAACAQCPRSDECGETWIVPEMVEAYEKLHKAGHAHSAEAWEDGRLVGGLYGVYVKGAFSGESMFFREDNASKLALLELVSALSAAGLEWMDVQMVTPVVELFGGRYVSRADYLDMLRKAHRRGLAEKLSLGS